MQTTGKQFCNMANVPPRASDKNARNGEEMLDVLAHDIMRYEMLTDRDHIAALASVLQGQGDDINDNIQLQEIEVPTVAFDNIQDIKLDTENKENQRDSGFKEVSLEDTDGFLRKNVNKNTDYKTRSDMKTFYSSAQQSVELRQFETIPFVELDAVLARFYLGMFLH